MKPILRGWKEGVLTADISSLSGHVVYKAGTTVRYRRYKDRNLNGIWTGSYEYHYLDTDNYNLIRLNCLYIQTP